MPEPGASLVECPLAEERFQEGCLAAAVRADERDLLAPVDRQARVFEQHLVARTQSKSLRFHDHAARAGRVEEVEAERLPLAGQRLVRARGARPLSLQPSDLRELGLRLLRLRLLVAEAFHEAFEPSDVHGDPLRGPRCGSRPLGLLATPLVPGAREEVRAAGCQLEHRGRNGFEEPAVVRDEDHRRVQRLELAFEPLQARDVEVVRRLVQQEQVRVPGQGACERRARELSSGERVEPPVEIRVDETEPSHGGRDPIAPPPAAGVLESCLRRGVVTERCLVVGAARHRLLEPAEIGLEREQVARAGEGVLAESEPAVAGRALIVQRHSRALRECELSGLK